MEILGMGIWSFMIVLGILGIAFTWMKIPKSKGTRKTIKTLSILGLVFGIFFLFVIPVVNFQWAAGPAGYQASWSIDIVADVTAATWDDTIVADADLWDAAQSDCVSGNAFCTALVTATRVGTAINTIAPDEILVDINVVRRDNDPNVDDADDFQTLYMTAPSSISVWTNTTNFDQFSVLAQDVNGRFYMYADDEGGDGHFIAPGETLPVAFMQPADSEIVRFGFQLNPVGFGADGQTAGISGFTMTWIVGGYSIDVYVQVDAIA